MRDFFSGIVFLKQSINVFSAFFCSKEKDIFCGLSGHQTYVGEGKSAHSFFTFCCAARRISMAILVYSPGMGKCSAFTDKVFNSGEKSRRGFAASGAAEHIVDPMICLMSPLVKGHGRADIDPIFGGCDPM